MQKLLIIIYFITSCAFGQEMPTVVDTIPPTGKFTAKQMISGGFQLVGISKNHKSFNLSNAEKLKEDHLHSLVKFNFDNEFDTSYNSESIINKIKFDNVVPSTDQPPPPPPVPNPVKKYHLGKHLKVFVDTSQTVSIPMYTDNSLNKPHTGGTVKDIYESEISFLSKYYKPSSTMVEGYPIIIENTSDSIRDIETQEGWIYMIQEALDKEGNWRPIEYIDYRAVCGNSFGSSKLLPYEYLISKIYKYEGEFKTKLRVRFSTHKEVYISNEFNGQINLSQFKIPEQLPQYSENVNEHFLKN